MKVRLVVPETHKKHCSAPAVHGQHYAFDGKLGTVLCGAGSTGAWVRFEGQGPYEYVGCPVEWLRLEQEEQTCA